MPEDKKRGSLRKLKFMSDFHEVGMSLLACGKLAVVSKQLCLIVVDRNSANPLMNSNHPLEFLRIKASLKDSSDDPEAALDAVITFSLAGHNWQKL